ncbi:MAG: hypothetical protein V7642_662 [Burkholderiales bacterium]
MRLFPTVPDVANQYTSPDFPVNGRHHPYSVGQAFFMTWRR